MYRLTDTEVVVRTADGACIPADPGNADRQQYEAWLAAGNTPEPYTPPPFDIQAAVTAEVQKRLDDFAKTRNYDGILSACTYASSNVPRFAAEGQYAVSARDAHWYACYAILADVQAGTRPTPTLEEVMAEMPPLQWPAI